MTAIERITLFALPSCVVALFACFVFVLMREIMFSKRKAISVENYYRYSRLYNLHPNKFLLLSYFIIVMGLSLCLVLDLLKYINRILVIPDFIFIVVVSFFIWHEIKIGRQNKDLSAFSLLYKEITDLKKESFDFEGLVKKNEDKKNQILLTCKKEIETYNSFVSHKIEESSYTILFVPIEQYIESAYKNAVDYNKFLDDYFNKKIFDYVSGNSQQSSSTGFGKKFFSKQEDFDNYFNSLNDKFKSLFDGNFVLNIQNNSFSNETNFFGAYKYCQNKSDIYSRNKETLLKIFNGFSTKELTFDFLKKMNEFTYENSKIVGVSLDNWWFVDGIFSTNLVEDKTHIIDDAIGTDNVDFVYRLVDYSFTLSPYVLNRIKEKKIDNYSTKCIYSLVELNKEALPAESKVCNLESKCISLMSYGELSFAQGILESGNFVQKKELIEDKYNHAYETYKDTYQAGKKMLIDFMINYNSRIFGVDKSKIYSLFKEFELSLDHSSVSHLSYFLLLLLSMGGCSYDKSLKLSFELGEIKPINNQKEYLSRVKDYVIRQNNIKFKRITHRIENKRQLLDDLIKAL